MNFEFTERDDSSPLFMEWLEKKVITTPEKLKMFNSISLFEGFDVDQSSLVFFDSKDKLLEEKNVVKQDTSRSLRARKRSQKKSVKYNKEDREHVLRRYRQKREKRLTTPYVPKVHLKRRKLALKRPRIGGKFVNKGIESKLKSKKIKKILLQESLSMNFD
jgi:hypothetical protein